MDAERFSRFNVAAFNPCFDILNIDSSIHSIFPEYLKSVSRDNDN